MKKTVIASVALAAALFAVSCQKETNPAQNVSGPMTISAVSEGLNTPTKTELAFKYDVLWSSTDKIYVVDGQGNHDTFSLKGGVGTTKGTFKQDGDVTFEGEVQAYYPATMLQSGSPVWPASQTNDQTIPMYCKKTLSGEAEERMDFASLGSVLQIVFNTTQAGVTLQSIEIKDGSKTMSGAFHVDENGMAVIDATDKAGITLDLGTGKALGKGANYFNIAVPAGDYQDLTLVFTATDGAKCTMTKGKVNIACNTVGRLTLTGDKFKPDVPEGALYGKFSVSNDGGTTIKQVHFSQGNLYWDGSAFKFEANQYSGTSYAKNHVSHFYWSKNASVAYAEGYNDGSASGSDVFFTNETETTSKDGFTVNVGGTEQTGWRTLSTAEWTYLFNNHTKKWASVNGMKGYVIAPDGFEGTLADSYADDAALAAAGNLVFLPAAGDRLGSSVAYVGGSGNYCSSTARNGTYAYIVRINSDYVYPNGYAYRDSGYSVRLVMEEGSPAPSVVPVESVSLDKTAATLNVNGTVTLSATVLPDNATDKSVSWSSNNTGVATVDASGKVTAVAAGTATITVTTTDGGKTATCTVTVYDLPDGALPGKFSVSDTKKVHFSQGNLWYGKVGSATTATFNFEANQYDSTPSEKGDWDASHVSHFYWSNDVDEAIKQDFNWEQPMSNTDVFFTNDPDDATKSNPNFTVNVGGTEQTGWRTLSTAEWTYLFNNHTKKWATVNGVNGYVIAPDGFEGELADSYENDAKLVTAGNLVFLPAAGNRYGSNVSDVGGYGRYWSSTASDEYGAYRVDFDSDDVYPGYDVNRNGGYSVRLITESK